MSDIGSKKWSGNDKKGEIKPYEYDLRTVEKYVGRDARIQDRGAKDYDRHPKSLVQTWLVLKLEHVRLFFQFFRFIVRQ